MSWNSGYFFKYNDDDDVIGQFKTKENKCGFEDRMFTLAFNLNERVCVAAMLRIFEVV